VKALAAWLSALLALGAGVIESPGRGPKLKLTSRLRR